MKKNKIATPQNLAEIRWAKSKDERLAKAKKKLEDKFNIKL